MPTPITQFFAGRMPSLLPHQQRQSTEGTWEIPKYKYFIFFDMVKMCTNEGLYV